MIRLMLVAVGAAVISPAASAAVCAGALSTSVVAQGERGTDYKGPSAALNDCKYPADGTVVNNDDEYTNVVSSFSSTWMVDFKFTKLTSIASFNLDVEADDQYDIGFYLTDGTLITKKTLVPSIGVAANSLKTFSSDPARSGAYVSSLALTAPVSANYVRITPAGGNRQYAIAEAEFYAPAAAAPEPSSWSMMVAGFGAIGVVARRRRAHAKGIPA